MLELFSWKTFTSAMTHFLMRNLLHQLMSNAWFGVKFQSIKVPEMLSRVMADVKVFLEKSSSMVQPEESGAIIRFGDFFDILVLSEFFKIVKWKKLVPN